MKKYYVIQDAVTGEYFWDYRTDSGFTQSLKEAKEFDTEDQAIEAFTDEYYTQQQFFDKRHLQIQTIYKV